MPRCKAQCRSLKYPANSLRRIFRFKAVSGKVPSSRFKPIHHESWFRMELWSARIAVKPRSAQLSHCASGRIFLPMRFRRIFLCGRCRLADLEHLANVQYPVSGNLSANVSVSGSQLNPAGSGSVDIANARVYDEPIQALALKFHTENESDCFYAERLYQRRLCQFKPDLHTQEPKRTSSASMLLRLCCRSCKWFRKRIWR